VRAAPRPKRRPLSVEPAACNERLYSNASVRYRVTRADIGAVCVAGRRCRGRRWQRYEREPRRPPNQFVGPLPSQPAARVRGEAVFRLPAKATVARRRQQRQVAGG